MRTELAKKGAQVSNDGGNVGGSIYREDAWACGDWDKWTGEEVRVISRKYYETTFFSFLRKTTIVSTIDTALAWCSDLDRKLLL